MDITDDPKPASIADANEKSVLFSCSLCEKKFTNERGYFGHLRIHSGEVEWPCGKCKSTAATFDSQSKLQAHENVCHTLVRPYKCEDCNDVFDRASQLNYHKRSYHLGERTQVCQICEKTFFRKNDLQTHLNVHLGTKQLTCQHCGKKFNHVSNLIRHNRTHVGAKPYPCSICDKRFTQVSSLVRHKRIHQKNTKLISENQEEEISANEDNPKVPHKKMIKRRHYCKICGLSFQFIILLRQHEKIHSKTIRNRGAKCFGKCQNENSNSDKKDETQKNNKVPLSAENLEKSSESDWINIGIQEESVFENYTEPQTEEEPTNSIRHHLLELDRKMNAIEIGSERDVSISISDILSPYNCESLELLSADSDAMEQNLYDNSNTDIKDDNLEKEYDIVQCLNEVDFASNLDSQLLNDSPEKNSSQSSNNRSKTLTKDSKASKIKPVASLTKDQKSLEGSQLYIEVCESEYLKSSRLHVLELEDIENVAPFQEVFEPLENDVLKSPPENIEEIVTSKSSIDVENINEFVYDAAVSLDTDETTLRLVQTETGETFYEFLISTEDMENFGILENIEEEITESNVHVDIQNNSTLLTCGNDYQTDKVETQSEHPNVLINESNCTELLQLLPNTESYKEISSNNDESASVVQLVHNENRSQLFEFITETLEHEQHWEDFENPKENEILDISDNSNCPNSSNAEIAASSNIQSEEKESIPNKSHSAKYRTQKFHCIKCDKWFSTAYNFKQHAGMHSSQQKNFQCQYCDESFAWKSTLNKHLATSHSTDGPLKFACDLCPKVYTQMSQVTEHVKRDHLKERNHVCTDCGKSFFKKFDLKTHTRTHTNERPYICRTCGKTFQHPSHIIRHERVHSGEKPYACDICHKTFTQARNLRAHGRKHTEILNETLEIHMD